MIKESEITFYADWKLKQRHSAITRLLNVVFLTSVRDVGTDDRNGTMVETEYGLRYMEGVIEMTVRETHPLRGVLGRLVRVVGVITDDCEKDMRDSSYSLLPNPGNDWIYPYDLTTPEEELVRDMTYNIPSSFRQLPLEEKGQRRVLKYEFEMNVLQKMRELQGDILVSDHYMARLDHLYRDPSLWGRVVNIHPAPTVEGPFCLRGKTPTADAIAIARSGIPTRTGATLHFINAIIDGGPPIAFIDDTPVFPDDQPQWLRYRNYTHAKLPLFISGLAYYARSIYPYLNELDDDDLQKMKAFPSD